MDKNVIKKFAVWARQELIGRVSQRAQQYGIGEDGIQEEVDGRIGGRVLSAEEREQRRALIGQVKAKGFRQVMEEAAYTWFNRFSALRFMEVNSYLPGHVRVFTDEENRFRPQILTEAIHLELEGLDREKVFAFKESEDREGLYRYLLMTQCNALSRILPGMFEPLSDYTELLFPDHLLREGSFLEQMISLLPEEDWQDAVQISGWLYQYYNSEKKDAVFASLKKNGKITRENIPAATQLFTPDWIVRYLVENSLGRLWVESVVSGQLTEDGFQQRERERRVREKELADSMGWKYYLPEADQTPEVRARLEQIRARRTADGQLLTDDLKIIDPCCGSGHILTYMFDVLMQIYTSYGYTGREAVARILEKNLYGLDIDGRAAQMAYFTVMMKARQYDRRFFSRGLQPHIYAIQDSSSICRRDLEYMGGTLDRERRAEALVQMKRLLDTFEDAGEYGSILEVEEYDWELLEAFAADAVAAEPQMSFDGMNTVRTARKLLPLVAQARAMGQKYDVVVTNPPYMGSSNMNPRMESYVKEKYPLAKADLFSVFMCRCRTFSKADGFTAMITQHGWMFLGSYEKFRRQLLTTTAVESMVHLGTRAFDDISGEVVQTTAFVLRKAPLLELNGAFCRLVDGTGEAEKEELFRARREKGEYYVKNSETFLKIPNLFLAYWLDERLIRHLVHTEKAGDFGSAKQGLITSDNDRFLRLWFEVDRRKLNQKWFPYNKGGGFRRWYGNIMYTVNWENDGFEICHFTDGAGKLRSRPQNVQYYFKPGLTWNDISTTDFCCRKVDDSVIFDASGPTYFLNDPENMDYFLGVLNSTTVQEFMDLICQGLHYSTGHIPQIPIVRDHMQEISALARENVRLAREDWDSFETSMDFKRHPLVRGWGQHVRLADEFAAWSALCRERYDRMKANEEQLNQLAARSYGLEDLVSCAVDGETVSVRLADEKREVRSLISYAVGCMFGRYALDREGVVNAGEAWDSVSCGPFPADPDNIIPITDDEYFEDDIVARFIHFLEVVYGPDDLEENLRFVAEALGGSGTPRAVIRTYFLTEFYRDHCAVCSIPGSGKRPIYWLFDSGKKNGFKALTYMHRWERDTLARLRTDYLFEQQSRYQTAMESLTALREESAGNARVKLDQKLARLRDQEAELRSYEEQVRHLADRMPTIDLDEGVKHNYDRFRDILAKIK